MCEAMSDRKSPMSLSACTSAPVGIAVNVPIRVRVAGAVRSPRAVALLPYVGSPSLMVPCTGVRADCLDGHRAIQGRLAVVTALITPSAVRLE